MMDEMNRCEILAPAGSFDALIAAVRGGCDAVYLGGKTLSARAGAKNFDNKELENAIRYCHERGVKVYLAANTLITDKEIPGALEQVLSALALHIDAIIVQSPGLAQLVKKHAPFARIHGSTQMSVHTPSGARALYDAGFDRVVLSRELSKQEIISIRKSCDIELEVFVHGALCMSVSGQCYMSAFLGGRSGNRGECAQPCRLPFSVQGGTGHDLSLKDLSLLSRLSELEEIGIDSLKIEGRMKRPEYVYKAVNAAAYSLKNGYLPEKDIETLEDIFSRSGFTSGYFDNKTGKDMFGTRKKENVTSASNELLSQLRQKYKDEPKTMPVSFEITLRKNTPATLMVTDNHGNQACAKTEPPQAAKTRPTNADDIDKQLKKTGGTPFFVTNITHDVEDGLFMSAGAMNSLRKNALDLLLKQAAKGQEKSLTISFKNIEGPTRYLLDTSSQKEKCKPSEKKLVAYFQNTDISLLYKEFDKVFVPIFTPQKELIRLKNEGFKLGLAIPRGMFTTAADKKAFEAAADTGFSPQEIKYIKALENAAEIGVTDVLAQNIGAVFLAKSLNLNIYGGFGLNIANSYDLRFYEKQGLKAAILSPELSTKSINGIYSGIPTGTVVYGHFPLMLTRNCPGRNGHPCSQCKVNNDVSGCTAALTDRMRKKFFVECEDSCSNILNSVPTYNLDRVNELDTDFLMLIFNRFDHNKHEKIYKMLKDASPFDGAYTRGCSNLQ